MPEGDTLHIVADRLVPFLMGRRLDDVQLRVGTGRRYGPPRAALRRQEHLVGGEVRDVYALGKHLVIDIDGWALRTHLGMSGSWHRYPLGKAWQRPASDLGVWLTTDTDHVLCFRPPTVLLSTRSEMARHTRHLGPDLLADPDWEEIERRVRAQPNAVIADLLLDQTVASGIGNVYKNEVMFLHGVHPDRTVEDIGVDEVVAMFRKAQELLAFNVRRHGMRTTTGQTGEGQRTYVHGRSERPCRTCGTRLSFGRHGPQTRATWWCSICQPGPPADRS